MPDKLPPCFACTPRAAAVALRDPDPGELCRDYTHRCTLAGGLSLFEAFSLGRPRRDQVSTEARTRLREVDDEDVDGISEVSSQIQPYIGASGFSTTPWTSTGSTPPPHTGCEATNAGRDLVSADRVQTAAGRLFIDRPGVRHQRGFIALAGQASVEGIVPAPTRLPEQLDPSNGESCN